MCIYICNTETKNNNNSEGVQCLMLWRFSETVFLCKFQVALKDKVILKLFSPLQQGQYSPIMPQDYDQELFLFHQLSLTDFVQLCLFFKNALLKLRLIVLAVWNHVSTWNLSGYHVCLPFNSFKML